MPAEGAFGDRRAQALALTVSGVLAAATFLDLPLHAYFAMQGPAQQALWRSLTALGNSGWMLTGSAMIALGALAARGRARSRRLGRGLEAATALALYAFAAVGLLGLLAATAKLAIGRPRPKMLDAFGAFELQPLAFSYKLNSFPSGHATTALALATALALMAPRWRAAIYTLAAWVAFSRVPVGAHFASDVAGGAALGHFGARALARAAAARGWAFGPGLAPRRPVETLAALRYALRRAARAAFRGRRAADSRPAARERA